MEDTRLYAAAILELNSCVDVSQSAENALIREIGLRFENALVRIALMARMPMLVVESAKRNEARALIAKYNILGNPNIRNIHEHPRVDEVVREYNRLKAIKMESEKAHAPGLLGLAAIGEYLREEDDGDGVEWQQAIFSSQIILLWMAFEVLTADLWTAALNIVPHWGITAMQSKVGEPDQDSRKEPEARLKIPVHRFQQWDYNLKNHLGDLLQIQRKWNFQKRDEARAAYVAVFGEKDEICSVLAETDLRTLCAIRNCLVHKDGRADQTFLRQVNHVPEWASTSVPSRLVLRGDHVEDLFMSAAKAGHRLIALIDSRISSDSKH